MFARAGNDGGDDPYNFDIVGGYGGGGSKKSKKSKLGGKASLNKTEGASPSTSSLIPQESPVPDVSLGVTTTSAVLKDSLRASAPAGPTSALDKAMSFLNKYKQGGSGAATAKGASTSRKSTDVARTTFDEDEMDMSLSSDSGSAGRTPARKATSRLKPTRDKPVLAGTATSEAEGEFGNRPLTLSGMRSSGRFGTAKELGISESGGLDGPKAAVSPVGIPSNRFTNNSSEGGARYPADAGSPSEHQSSGLRLVVNIPGESSTYGSPVNRGSESDIESEGSAVVEVLEEQSPGVQEVSESEPWLGSLNSELGVSSEIDAGGSLGLVSPAREKKSGPDRRGFARSPPDRSALGKVMSIDDLAAVSRPQTSPNLRDRGTDAGDDSGGDRSERTRGSYAEDDDDDEDDYGDDAFEDQDVLMESIGEPALPTEGQNTHPTPTTEAPSHESRVGQSASPAARIASDQRREVGSRPLEAWSMPPTVKEEARPSPGTSDSGTSPRSRTNGADIDRKDGRAPPDTREAWVAKSARGSCAAKDEGEGTARAATGGVGRPSLQNTDQCRPQGDDSGRGTGKQETRRGSLSKRGVLIDRSEEASNPTRPPDTEVKVIARVDAVASVEYAHDPESGRNLRSCGTQMVGNSAAVQANIVVQGMAGTHTSVNTGYTTSSTHAPGVGYRTGEPYAKWGRFACEMPASCSIGRDPIASEGLWEHPSLNSPRRRPRSSGGNGPDANAGQGNDAGNGGGNVPGGADSPGNVDDDGGAHLHDGEEASQRFGDRDATRASTIPSVRGGPAYLETFLDVMEKSQAETCFTWQQVLGTAAPRRVPVSPDEKVRREEKMGTADVVDDTEPCSRGGPARKEQKRYQGPSEADIALRSIMTATQDSFRRQLADMRENLNKIRYRAEVAGRQAYYGYNYESVSDVHDYLARARPPPTRPAEALMAVDPSLTREEAETLADGGTVPPSPVEH